MKRELFRLPERVYDLCVIGGGIYGACVARDATLRGLSVALVDKGDFGHATSSNTLRIIHGGFRYLQHGDIARVRESIRERTVWMQIAPHLVHPLPFLIPTYKNSIPGKALLSTALLLYDLISFDRNRLKDPQKHIPSGRVISRREFLHLIPGCDARNLTGGAIFYDGQMYNSERLLLSCLKSAAKAGAILANYVEVTGFLKEGSRVTGVRAKDVFTGDKIDIRARMVVNAAGPWVTHVLDCLKGQRTNPPLSLAKAFNLGVNQLLSKHALGLYTRESRFFFITPWHNRSLIGTAHLPYDEAPDEFRLHEKDIRDFIAKIRNACPGISLREDDILFFQGGLVPARGNRPEGRDVQLSTRCQILDHRKSSGVDGLVSVIGVKFTMARSTAERVIDRVFEKLGYKPPRSRSSETPIYGGWIDGFDTFLAQAAAQKPYELQEGAIRHLVHNYGSAYPEVLRYADSDPDSTERLTPASEVLKAEVLYGIDEEMAQKLADVVLRRTELGAVGYPGDACLGACAAIMARALGWGHARTDKELEEAKAAFPSGPVYA